MLVQHPCVADAAVIGIPHDTWGETVHAVVVPVLDPPVFDSPVFDSPVFDSTGPDPSGPGLDPEELIGWARQRLAGFKCPTSVSIVGALPRNATGKVQRAALREPFWSRAGPGGSHDITATTVARPLKATRKGRQTDEAFRAAARVVFARDGYLNAKISDIAAEAGRSVASFYNYYDTKADLLIALAEEFHAENATSMAGPAIPGQGLARRWTALRGDAQWPGSGARTPGAAAN